ncbi:MAG: MarR family transcriptional regulator [Halobacteriales archaeon]|nr:MarR family transcriptional regulator [Halobacteriales archaeon]
MTESTLFAPLATMDAVTASPVAAPTILQEPAGHPRTRIIAEVRSRPGVSITDLALATELGHTTVCHHLGVLQRRGLVVRERWGGSVRIFPTDLSPTHRALLAQVRAGRTGEVLRALAARPRSSPTALGRELGLHRQAVQWHLSRLEKAGIVRVDREHRPYRITLTVKPESVLRLVPDAGGAAPRAGYG